MKKYNGSITLEMTLVFPIVILSIFAIVILGFYLNDVVCSRAIFQQYGIISNMNEKDEITLKSELQDLINNSLIISKINNLNINREDNKTNIQADISINVNFWGINKVTEINVEIQNTNNKEFVTGAKVAIDILGGNQE